VLGDGAEWDETQAHSCMANAAFVKWDPARNSLHVLSSIVGLPPIFIYRKPHMVAVTSELRLLRAIAGLKIAVNPQAAIELFTVGFPLEHRSLFTDVTIMPGGHSFRVDALGRVDLTQAWQPTEAQSETDWSSYIDSQKEAFRHAVSKLRMSDSLFALTGGLDTRAILAVLSEKDIKLTAYTISGGRALSLDASLARTLCNAYGMPHVVVSLGDQFLRNLPTYVVARECGAGA
jgi:asparagine synthetase B (glutamine-hydrolysing)